MGIAGSLQVTCGSLFWGFRRGLALMRFLLSKLSVAQDGRKRFGFLCLHFGKGEIQCFKRMKQLFQAYETTVSGV